MLDFLHKSLVEQGLGELKKKKKKVHVPLVNKNSQNYLSLLVMDASSFF